MLLAHIAVAMRNQKLKKFWFVMGLWVAVLSRANAEVQEALPEKELIQVSLHQLAVDPASQQPVVLLTDADGRRALFIWIGPAEARAIYSEQQGVRHARPLTHDLIERIIQKVNGKIRRIVITHTRENVYYATIVMEKEGGLIEIDARPSDSIVLALKFKSPIFVTKTLFEEMSLPIPARGEIQHEYGLTLQELTLDLAQYLSFESEKGVLVSGVRKGSRAERDGIENGDIIVAIGDQTIEDVVSLIDALAKSQSQVRARIFRKTRFLTLSLHLK